MSWMHACTESGSRQACRLEWTSSKMLSETVAMMLHACTADRDFLPFSDVEKSVRDDVATLRASNLVTPGAGSDESGAYCAICRRCWAVVC